MSRIILCLLSLLLFCGLALTQHQENHEAVAQSPTKIDCFDPSLPIILKSICRSNDQQIVNNNQDAAEILAKNDPAHLARNPYLRNTVLRVFVIIFGVISILIMLIALGIYVMQALKTRAPSGFQKYNFLAEAFFDTHLGIKTKRYTLIYILNLLVFVFVFVVLSDRRTLEGNAGCWVIAGLNYYLMLTLCSLSITVLFRVMVEYGHWNSTWNSIVNFCSGENSFIQPLVLAFTIPGILLFIFATSYNEFLKRNDDFCWVRSDHRFPALGVPLIIHILALLCLIPILARRFPHLGISRLINKFFTKPANDEIEEGHGTGTLTNVHEHSPPENCAYWWHFVPQAFLGIAVIFENLSYSHNHCTFWHVMFVFLITWKVPALFALRFWHWKRHRALNIVHPEEGVTRDTGLRKTLTETAELPESFETPSIQVHELDTISEHAEPQEIQLLQKDVEFQSLHSRSYSHVSEATSVVPSVVPSVAASEAAVESESASEKESSSERLGIKPHILVVNDVSLDESTEMGRISIHHATHKLAFSPELPQVPLEIDVTPRTNHKSLEKTHPIFDSDEEKIDYNFREPITVPPVPIELDEVFLHRQDTFDAPPKPPRGITPQNSITMSTSLTPPPTPHVDIGEGAQAWWSKTVQSQSSESAAHEHLHEDSETEDVSLELGSQEVAIEFSSDSEIVNDNVAQNETYQTVIESETITHFEGLASATINVFVRKYSVKGSSVLCFEPVLTDLPSEIASVTTAASLAPSLTSLIDAIGYGAVSETISIGRGSDVEDGQSNRNDFGTSDDYEKLNLTQEAFDAHTVSANTVSNPTNYSTDLEFVGVSQIPRSRSSSEATEVSFSKHLSSVDSDATDTEQPELQSDRVETTVNFSINASESSKSTGIVLKPFTESSAVLSTPRTSLESLEAPDLNEDEHADTSVTIEEQSEQPVLHDAVHEAITHSISQSLLAADATDTETSKNDEHVETLVEIISTSAEEATVTLLSEPRSLPTEYASDTSEAASNFNERREFFESRSHYDEVPLRSSDSSLQFHEQSISNNGKSAFNDFNAVRSQPPIFIDPSQHGVRTVSPRSPLHGSSISQSHHSSSSSTYTEPQSSATRIERPPPRRSLYFDDV